MDAFKQFLEDNADYLTYGVLAAIIALVIVLASMPKKNVTTREITFAAVCVAMSFALSYIKVSFVSSGGSVTLAAIVPLVMYAYFAGVRKGLLAALAYSLLQFIQSPGIVNFVQVMLDYVFAFTIFGAVAALKMLRDKLKGFDLIITLAIAYVVRYFCHVFAGLYWLEGTVGAFGASMIYSATYVPADFVIAAAVIAGMIISGTLTRLEKIYKQTAAVSTSTEPSE